MFTDEEVKHLLELPKKLLDKNAKTVSLSEEKTRLEMQSTDNGWKFILDIFSNKKISFSISLHHMEKKSYEGLLRIDYKRGHQNPEIADQFVPDYLRPYAGKSFQNESHIHLFVQGYKNLAWAIPLKDYNYFPVKEINSESDFTRAIQDFAEEINLKTKLEIQRALL